MKRAKEYFLMLIFLVLILIVTFYTIYDKNSLIVIFNTVKDIEIYYIIIFFIIIFLYFLLQGIYMKTILGTLKQKVSLKKCVFYSMIEFYFSGITPSSTGGQPVQLYYMTKDNIPIRKSYITLMLNTIYFKLIVLILGILALVFESDYIFSNGGIYILFFILGFIVDLAMIILCLYLVFKKDLISKVLTKLISFAKRFKIFKKKVSNIDIEETSARYKDEISFINSHKLEVVFGFILTFIQRLLLFSVIYVVYRALGFSELNYFELLFIQVVVQMSIEAFPLPGGAGLSEGMLHSSFVMIFASRLADVGMLLTRTFSFYVPLIICGLVILFHNILSRKRKINFKR